MKTGRAIPGFGRANMTLQGGRELGVLALCGLAFPIAKRQWMLVVFLLFFLLPVFIWPFTDEMYRFLIPVAPIFAIAFVRTLFFFREILAKRFGAWSHAPAFAVLLAVFVLEGVVLSQLYRFSHQEVVYSAKNGEPIRFRWFYYDPAQQALDQALDWFKGNGDPSRVVVAMSTDHVYLRTE